MAVNPNGMVAIFDGGAPRTFTGVAKQDLSGGQFVGVSGAAGLTGSSPLSFNYTDIQVINAPDGGANFVGITTAAASSGAQVCVATRGFFLVEVSGPSITAGQNVTCNDKSEVTSGAQNFIGKVLNAGSDGEYVIFAPGYQYG